MTILSFSLLQNSHLETYHFPIRPLHDAGGGNASPTTGVRLLLQRVSLQNTSHQYAINITSAQGDCCTFKGKVNWKKKKNLYL